MCVDAVIVVADVDVIDVNDVVIDVCVDMYVVDSDNDDDDDLIDVVDDDDVVDVVYVDVDDVVCLCV